MNLPELSSDFKATNTMLFNAHLPMILRNALDVGLFDALVDGPMNPEQISGKLGCDAWMIEALLEVLRGGGYLEKQGETFSLCPVSREFLVSTAPAFQGSVLAAMANMSHLLGNAKEIMTQGAAPHNEKMWASAEMMEMLLKSGKGGKIQDAVDFVTGLPEFSSMERLCDVAGSFGYYAMGLLDAKPDLSGVICDLPEVVAQAEPIIAEAGFGGRLEAMGVNLEAGDDFGGGYDLVFVSNYLYAWSGDDRLVDFLKRIRLALNPGGVFVSRHMSLEVEGDDLQGQWVMEYATRLGGYPTHAISGSHLTAALTEAGFSDFTVRRPGDGSYDNTLTLAARVAA